ncbi:hypothetical protein Tco_0838993 [Tanacetum coccineum]|uniref:Uncharacterized protein n=1 Tax=Tanacetum coccineum TaxID=301880 RepID=A0ABQ5ATA8_9ASTR
MTESPLVDSSFAVPVFSSRYDPIACLNKSMAFLITIDSSRFPSTNNQLRTSSNPRNQSTIQDGRVTMQQVQGRQWQSYSGTGYKSNATSSGGTMQEDMQGLLNVTTVKVKEIWLGNTLGLSIENLDTYDSDCDDISNSKAILMANISKYGSNVVSEVPHSETYLNVMKNQGVHAMRDFEQPPAVDFTNNKIHSDSNIILYSPYLQETQQEKLSMKEQVDSLEQNLSKQIKEKECLLQTFTVFKSESKEKEDKYMENKIDLEKKIKELDNILFKVVQSAQTVKAQRIKPTLYDGIVISDKLVAMPMIDDEEALILEEKSRSKMFEKEKDPEAIKQNISHKPIDYEKLNRVSDDFGKRFTP